MRLEKQILAVLVCMSYCGVGHSADPVSFNRDITPILATHCYECHGPDGEQREAGLRLDLQSAATTQLKSGTTAIVPGDSQRSELVRRLVSRGDDRMPPADHGEPLSDQEVSLLRQWIDSGAIWQGHWAFEPLSAGTLPHVTNARWAANPIDRYVLSQLEQVEITPAPRADRHTLIRRLYFDVVGLPPSADTVRAFANDARPNAYEHLVDRLLASPQYGERWGRHWLDVARYADSNGGDENHAYPLAHRYRDYVIDAINEDMTYDRFIRQQLAGDLLKASDDERLNMQRTTATGYLAIGMKILAEQDPVKKRADMVDEQIDTFGRTFLGLSLGCARCHDHKFDPIPTKDYYALAGIFHSSQVQDQTLTTRQYETQLATFTTQMQNLESKLERIQSSLDNVCSENAYLREAESFDRGNVVIDNENYGQGIGIISDPGSQDNFAEYDFDVTDAGRYLIQLRYAAQKARPGSISLNGKVVVKEAIKKTTGGWHPAAQQWFTEGVVEFKAGKNVLRIDSKPMMSHIDKLRVIDSKLVTPTSLKQLDRLRDQLTTLEEKKPTPTMVMGIEDQDAKNVQVHKRGSHLELGDEVQRSFLQVLDGKSRLIPENTSGRLELANWLTENAVATRLTSRVIVNRLWHWHFGRGLVGTPDDFGIRGDSPTHPQLMDYLCQQLIARDWSLKAIHRLILTSETFKMSAKHDSQHAMQVDPTNRLIWKRDRTRLAAESIRDALLVHADELIQAFGDAPMNVKSQDPSPEDQLQNLTKYESSRRRSVYLPVVRSNVYEFFTLFDFPNASTPVGKRNQTTIPTQALWLMNSPYLVRHATKIVGQLNAELNVKQPTTAIRELYITLFARVATEEEVASGQRFLQSCLGEQGNNAATGETALARETTLTQDTASTNKTADLAVWSLYCQVLLSSNEYLYLN